MDERYVITDKVRCSACNKPLWKEKDNWYPSVEPELMPNTLGLTLEGWYGGFFDNINGNHSLLLCHECAHKLVGASPFLLRLLKGGHFHGFTNDPAEELCECIQDFYKDWGRL